MNLQDDFHAAGQEYARRLEKQQETDRLEALRLEARKHGNASAFADAMQHAFDQIDPDTNDQEN
ncbi:unannotated protein [freshwater metagenome]|uniref:Unannotated protein n=1 Tax=freshwater metagenome TaxID=449393 RepID=A0A6J7KB25_9ZZZZ|nr:hypothetical protein [Actinomycetota bacterium]